MAQSRAPSVKTLTTQLKDVDVEKAMLLRRIMKADRDELIELAPMMRNYCSDDILFFQNPSTKAYRMREVLLDNVLSTFGVEHCFKNQDGIGGYIDDQSGDNWLGTYLNAGDTYAPTLINTGNGWRIGCMADIVERHI